eukprot:g2316.t1
MEDKENCDHNVVAAASSLAGKAGAPLGAKDANARLAVVEKEAHQVVQMLMDQTAKYEDNKRAYAELQEENKLAMDQLSAFASAFASANSCLSDCDSISISFSFSTLVALSSFSCATKNLAVLCAWLLAGIKRWTGIGAINKIAFQQGGGHYTFAPTSALAMAEATKFGLSLFFHINDFEGLRASSEGATFDMKLDAAKKAIIEYADPWAILNICLLAFLYLFNNLMNFYLNGPADPGSIFLFKSGSTVITAIMLRYFLNRPVNELQWGAIVMQVAGLVIVQFDPCKGRAVLEPYVYGLMAISTTVTATNAVRNDYMLKNYKMSMHCQNMFLYSAGCFFNMLAFFFLPGWCTHTPPGTGFFDGYDNLPAVLVVLFNALIGIAISFVYKYTDAVVKTFASATVTVNLVVFSAVYLGKETTLVAWNGVAIVIVATFMYSQASKKKAAPAAKPAAVTPGAAPAAAPAAGK